LRWITHGPEGDIVSLYTTLPWDALCAEVAKLRIEPLVGQLLELRKAANSNGEPGADGAGLLPPLLPPHRLTEKAQHSHALESSRGSAQGGTRNLTSEHQPGQSEHISPEISAAFNEPTRARCSPVESDRSNVVSARSIAERDEVADLEAIRTVWLRNPDEKSLRSALLDLLRRLEDRE